MPGTLYVVSTPLGNPGDLSPRAVESLRSVEILFAEDTRSAARLLASLGLTVPLRSCFDANEEDRAAEASDLLAAGRTLGLVSEAGTPAISDPGHRLVRAAITAGARVVPVPGPSAVLAALVASGLPTDRFFFAGFPPRKPGPRQALFASLRELPATLIFYESPVRAAETLRDLMLVLGDRAACVARELTKTHEEFARGTLSQLIDRYAEDRPLGEVTLVVAGASDTPQPLDDEAVDARARALLAEGLSSKDAATRLALETGLPRGLAYDRVLRARERR